MVQWGVGHGFQTHVQRGGKVAGHKMESGPDGQLLNHSQKRAMSMRWRQQDCKTCSGDDACAVNARGRTVSESGGT